MNYIEYAIAVANLIPVNATSTQFQNLMPNMINYAEQRIYRELQLISTRITNSSSNLTINNRSFTLPTNLGNFITVTGVNVITPAGQTASGTGDRNPLTHVPQTVCDYLCKTNNSSSATDYPIMYYMKDQTTLIVGPAPGAAFNMEVIGTIRPTPLSASNTTTFLTQYLPDLFIAASMVFAGNNIRDFGVEAGNANIGPQWEQQYKDLLASANSEELKKKYGEELSK